MTLFWDHGLKWRANVTLSRILFAKKLVEYFSLREANRVRATNPPPPWDANPPSDVPGPLALPNPQNATFVDPLYPVGVLCPRWKKHPYFRFSKKKVDFRAAWL